MDGVYLPVRHKSISRSKPTTVPTNGNRVFTRSNIFGDKDRQGNTDSIDLLVIDVDDVEVFVLWRYGSSVDRLWFRHIGWYESEPSLSPR